MNETAARQHFGGTPLGRRFGTFPGRADYEIVGAVRDARHNSLRDPAPLTLYLPLAQRPQPSAFVQVRAASEPMSIVRSVREAVRQVDANLPLANISTHTEQIEQRVAQEKVVARACLLFGAMALLRAAVGLFGLMSFTVARRTNEIGIRMALGARGLTSGGS